MTIDELQEWIASAKRQSDQDIGEYKVEIVGTVLPAGREILDAEVDHGLSTLFMSIAD